MNVIFQSVNDMMNLGASSLILTFGSLFGSLGEEGNKMSFNLADYLGWRRKTIHNNV